MVYNAEKGGQKMAISKQRFSITVDDDLYRKIEDFRFDRRIKSQSKAVNALMEIGFKALTDGDINIGPSISTFEHSILQKYNCLDLHGKEMVEMVLNKEYERCAVAASIDASTDEALSKQKKRLKGAQ